MPRYARLTRLLVLIALVVASGCGAQAATMKASGGPRPAASPKLQPSVTSPAPSPSPAKSDAKSPPAAQMAAPAPAPPAPIAAAPMAIQFPLVALAEPVRGQVTITPGPGSYGLLVQASGLPPGSAHSVHLHFGNCPSTGVHILVLGTLVADGAGAGSLSVTLGRPYAGNGRFVIIYLGPSAGPLAACAQLAG